MFHLEMRWYFLEAHPILWRHRAFGNAFSHVLRVSDKVYLHVSLRHSEGLQACTRRFDDAGPSAVTHWTVAGCDVGPKHQ